jgi:kanamycin kinase
VGVPVTVPHDLNDRYQRWRWELVDRRLPPAATYRLELDGEVRFLKITPADWQPRLPDEAVRLRWAAEHLPVPTMIEYGSDGEHEWLMTAALPGVDATKHQWATADPARLAEEFGAGLRRFHDTAPVWDCPFDAGALAGIDVATGRVAAGHVDADAFAARHGMSPREAVRQLRDTVPVEDDVVGHGDYCLPNVLMTDDRVTGFVDLPLLGVAGRWSDLATGARSCEHDLGQGFQESFFAGYGVRLDLSRLAWYDLLHSLLHP